MLLQIAYVGSRGTHLRVGPQIDPIPAQYLSTSPFDNAVNTRRSPRRCQSVLPATAQHQPLRQHRGRHQLLRPYPQFTRISSISNDGFSWYHSLQATLQKRFTQDYFFTVAYTWCKYMEAITYLNYPDPIPSRVISSQDRPQRLVTSFTYLAPSPRRGFSARWPTAGKFRGSRSIRAAPR